MQAATETTRQDLLFSEEELSFVNLNTVPKHVAIIMDGNRRWAKKRNISIEEGHWQGAETLDRILRAANQLGIKVLTVFTFSTENWKRAQKEVEALMHLLKVFLISKRILLRSEGVRLKTIGDLSKLPESVQEVIYETLEYTKEGKGIDLVLALNYGGRDEIKRAFLKLIEEVESKRIQKDEITERLISAYLDTAEWPDPDILIRPSGDARISNFLNWQLAYSEIYYTHVLWPDFTKVHLLDAVVEFQKRDRRFGV